MSSVPPSTEFWMQVFPRFTAVCEVQSDGWVKVTAFVNARCLRGWVTTPGLAPRLAAAVEAGKAFNAHDAERVVVDGVPTVLQAHWAPIIMDRYMKADLFALGF